MKKRIVLIATAILLAALLIIFMPKILLITVSLDEFKKYILSTGHFGVLIIIFFQMLQTVIAPIPGEVIQMAGGYLYGNFLGSLYSVAGLFIGAALAFYFTRFIGRDFATGLLEKKNLKWISNIMNSSKFQVILFIIFLVPGLPKDFMIYVAALTAIKPMKFFVILILSRLPWIMASAGIGANINAGNYALTLVICVVAAAGLALGMLYKDKIIKRLSV